jgi:DNA-binding NtrC family response regulator
MKNFFAQYSSLILLQKIQIIPSNLFGIFHFLVLLASTLLFSGVFMKVLIIEKDKTVRQSLSYFMERHKNCEVFLAGSKKEGISLFATTPFDIILCGDRLPDGNGLEMLKEWMTQNPKLISILMTVQGDELSRQEAMRVGVRGYLEKPFDLKQLEEVISISECGLRNVD